MKPMVGALKINVLKRIIMKPMVLFLHLYM
jgi:hypothetical protein